MADELQYTSADEWAADAPVVLPAPLQVPSGKTALVRAPGLEAFLRTGMIPNSLLGMMRKALDTNKGQSKSAAQEKREMDAMFDQITKDPERLDDLFKLVDAATVYCVVKPRVKAVPVYTEDVIGTDNEDKLGQPMELEDRPGPGENEERFLWVDQVDMEDKMFIFNFACAGTRDVERFREQSDDVLDRAGHGKPVARTTKRTAGDQKGKPKRK